jgi:hypothetical protein
MCIACGRGLCPECQVDGSGALSCRGACERAARRILDLREFAATQPSIQRMMIRRQQFALIAAGCVTILGACAIAAFLWGQGPWAIAVPLAACLFGAFQIALALQRRASLTQFRLCSHCGYNLTGRSERRCPECGKVGV